MTVDGNVVGLALVWRLVVSLTGSKISFVAIEVRTRLHGTHLKQDTTNPFLWARL